jgi:2-phosphosulfolactate phosphatase
MKLDVVLLPRDLTGEQCHGHAVVVFDVLRATTTMAAALAAGAREIRVFGEIDEARDAADAFEGPHLLTGERDCLPPPGYDLGNSPDDFNPDRVGGRVLFMATTNGTRAIIAARSADHLFTGALVNAAAVARCLARLNVDVTLLCAGTRGVVSMEDLLGCGAVIDQLQTLVQVKATSDTARVALRLFKGNRKILREVIAEGQGGRNVRAAHLDRDLDFTARLNAIDIVGRVHDDPLRVEAEAPGVQG